MKPELITSVLTLMFAQDLNITDNVNIMRANILAMEIESRDHTIESIKKTSAYMSCHYDIPFNNEFLQSLLDKKKELKKSYSKRHSDSLING